MQQPNPLDYFAGGVPASAVFQMAVLDIRKLTGQKQRDDVYRTLPEICFIGLVSYFEAFCKDCFASILNIAPRLLQPLKDKSYEVRIDPITALEMGNELPFHVGFLVCEGLDFGSARKINAMYNAILGITPFGRKDEVRYSRLLSDRNLLVHHGGIYTESYLKQRELPPSGPSRAFMDSLRVDLNYLSGCIDFLLAIAKEMVKGSKTALAQKVKAREIHLAASEKRALKLFDDWDES